MPARKKLPEAPPHASPNGGAKVRKIRLHIVPTDEDTWVLRSGRRVVQTFGTKDEAVTAARAMARETPADIVLHRTGGRPPYLLSQSQADEMMYETWKKIYERAQRGEWGI